MRILFALMLLIFSAGVKAQTILPGSYMDHLQRPSFAGNSYLKDSTPGKKWVVTKYMGISTSVGFFNGGSTTVLAVPVGIQINRRLTNNWYAFAGVSAAPAYVNFNHSFLGANTNKAAQPNNFLRSGSMNMYSRAELGLLYTNDQKTFSISGSISIERSSYPLVPFNQVSTVRPNTFIAPPVK
jgi:hypothetical protein